MISIKFHNKINSIIFSIANFFHEFSYEISSLAKSDPTIFQLQNVNIDVDLVNQKKEKISRTQIFLVSRNLRIRNPGFKLGSFPMENIVHVLISKENESFLKLNYDSKGKVNISSPKFGRKLGDFLGNFI
jgi:hypothetical protein